MTSEFDQGMFSVSRTLGGGGGDERLVGLFQGRKDMFVGLSMAVYNVINYSIFRIR
jgi:hypothetical protein